MGLLDLIYNPSKRVISSLESKVAEINFLEQKISKLTDAELKAKTEEFKSKVAPLRQGYEGQESRKSKEEQEQIIEEISAEAFAVMREAMKRVWGERHFDVQLIGGLVLHQGKIAEMKTGEGKTIVATLPLYLNALSGRGAHLVTVNDYLSKHQGEGMGEVFDFLGFSTGVIQSNQETYRFKKNHKYNHYSECEGLNLEPCSRKEAYACDITYGTNNEFGFDYLRDNMAPSVEQCVQRDLHFAIVDEVDSILIDEARTPLIISAAAEESAGMYQQFAALVPRLKEGDDYIIDEKDRAATLTDKGIKEMEKMLQVENIYEAGGINLVHHLEEALKAHTLFKKDRDYVVRDGEIIIVDEFTGRLMIGRRYSEGLHQAIEAKENVEVKRESQTLATISFQNLFRMYQKLSGMTGTAATEAEEFYKIYKLDVVEIPTNKVVIRRDLPDQIYKTETAKIEAIVKDIETRHEKGQPVLIGTVSVSKNEELSKRLKKAGVKHEILNAKHHLREAKIIAKAGLPGAVTVATNMAGRGTDIRLGEGVRELGGLHVLGTGRHEARRIDNQLRGRSGRQGDPGSSQFFVSMEDDLMRIFGGDRLKSMMDSLGLPDDMPIENRIISRSIESAQKRVEGYNFDTRKHLVEYDDVMNKQREVIYKKRRKILESQKPRDKGVILNQPDRQAGDSEESSSNAALDPSAEPALSLPNVPQDDGNGNSDTLKTEILDIIDGEIDNLSTFYYDDKEKIKTELKAIVGEVELPSVEPDKLKELAHTMYEVREKKFGSEIMRNIEKAVYLRTIDMLWIEHLTTMDELRTGIGLRGYGQRDPLVEYKQESFRLFEGLLKAIESNVARTIFKVELNVQPPQPKQNLEYKKPDEDAVGNFSEEEKANVNLSQARRSQDVVTDNVTTKIIDKSKSVFERMKESAASGPKSTYRRQDPSFAEATEGAPKHRGKVGRNDPCPCGATKPDGRPVKYKHCHGK